MAIYKPGRPVKYNLGTEKGTKPPSKPGEYRIRDNSGQISYVGETNNLARRMYQHTKSGKLSVEKGNSTFEYKIADGRSSSRTRRIHEKEKIAKHNPYLNKSGGGEGRLAKKKGA
ncbi:MAG: GIY-YIG nuclease family protein [Clostridia bacterium]|nr:GIY-YIG nuclease family protein [Clostridia bacterium]